MAQRALVTGAAGFVGANLCRRLLRDGHEVHALVRPGGDLWRLEDVRADLTLHEFELGHREALATMLEGIGAEWIFHLAAHGAYSWQTDVEAIFATNTLATAQLLDLACATGFDAFVQAGSSSEYGYKDHPPHEREWIEPNSAYAASKAAATLYARALAQERDAHIVTLRLYSAYGPWEEPNRLMPALACYGLEGRLPPLVDPRTARDFVYVEDVCEAFVLAASADRLEPGIVLNLASGRQVTVGELVALVREELELDVEPDWSSMAARPWDTSVWVGDGRLIGEQLGWEARTPLADGFRELVGWLRRDPILRERYGRTIGLP